MRGTMLVALTRTDEKKSIYAQIKLAGGGTSKQDYGVLVGCRNEPQDKLCSKHPYGREPRWAIEGDLESV